MPSSTSSSEPGYERPLPAVRVGVAAIAAIVVLVTGIVMWERHWRAYGAEPSIRNSDGLWARERRRINDGEGDRTVIIGDSRLLFDVDLSTWQRLSGQRPIQLSLEGTSAMPVLEDLANDPDFTGLLIVGVAPDLFFSGFAYRGKLPKYYRDETWSQRISQWLSMRLIEPRLAFFDDDFELVKVIARQAWPARPGVPTYIAVRKLATTEADRNTTMWSKVETDPAYRALARKIWAQDSEPPTAGKRVELDRLLDEQLGRATKAVATLRARGVRVVFVRPPSTSDYLGWENRDFPRAKTWDVLLQRTSAPGIHFEDYPDMTGLELPEWSHLAARERPRYTEALYRAIARLPP